MGERPDGCEGRLDALAVGLMAVGLECVRRYEEPVPLLRVFHPGWSGRLVIGESVTVTCGPGSTGGPLWWFRSSSGYLLAPCGDVAGAAGEVVRLLAPFTPGCGAGAVSLPGPLGGG